MNITWTCRISSPDRTHDVSVPASVPGCVHTDLIRAGIVKDPFWRDNNERLQWIERCDVTYTGVFGAGDPEPDTFLVFRGLDVYASVYLNGEKLGETDDMFVSCSFRADGILKRGENVVEVRFRSPVTETEGLPKRSAAFTCERLYTRRVQCTYGWDWVGRFVTMGVWKPVELVRRHPDYIGDRREGIYVWTEGVSPYSAQVGIELAFTGVTGDGWAEMEITSPENVTVWRKKRRVLSGTVRETADIPDPMLWYPAGYGGQPLYRLTVRTYGSADPAEASETRTQLFGIRTVKILEIEDRPGSREAELAERLKGYPHLKEWDRNAGSSCFWLLVNDRRVFCQGANWVPCEPFPSAESGDKIRRLVSLARDAGVNMLRVWGGGIFGREEFYDACDELGIMATQDFLMACGDYPEEDPLFLGHLRDEAREAALTMRNHPSLVWWTGDNENAVLGDENSPEYNGRLAALSAIGPVLEKLDPHRRFLPSSPYGGVPYASGTRGTSHNTQFLGNFFAWVREDKWDGYREYFDRYLCRFTAEQPAAGMPFVSSLRKFMTDGDIFGEDTSISEYHTKNNPGLGDITLYGYIDRMARGIFGEYRDGADRIAKMQRLQCEWIRLSLELHRRSAWYSSGMIYWMWNDCWPAANGWSMVDYYGMPKPAYYAFKRAAKPVAGSVCLADGLTGERRVMAYVSYNGPTEKAEGTCRLYRYDIVTGREDCGHVIPVSLDPGESKLIFESALPELTPDTVLILDTETDKGRDRAFSLPPETRFAGMNFPDAEPEIISETDGYVEVRANETIPYAFIDPGETILEDNGAFLKKGETAVYKKSGKYGRA